MSEAPRSGLTYCANKCTRLTAEGNHIPTTTDAPSTLCSRCEESLVKWLKEIPDKYALLPEFQMYGTTDQNPESKATKRPDAPAPMRLGVTDLLDNRFGRRWNGTAPSEDRRGPLGLLGVYVKRIANERPVKQPAKGSITTECAFIARHLLWVLEQDWAAEMHHELKALYGELQTAIGEHRQRPVGRCAVDYPNDKDEYKVCGGPLMPQTYGGVKCVHCGSTWAPEELRRLGLILQEQNRS